MYYLQQIADTKLTILYHIYTKICLIYVISFVTYIKIQHLVFICTISIPTYRYNQTTVIRVNCIHHLLHQHHTKFGILYHILDVYCCLLFATLNFFRNKEGFRFVEFGVPVIGKKTNYLIACYINKHSNMKYSILNNSVSNMELQYHWGRLALELIWKDL